MLTQISIRNFQSIAAVDLDLGPLVVIVGPGNTGKTALLRALTALAFNRTGADFIRYGEKACGVAVTTDEGHEIAWVKDTSTAKYVVDGQELTKLAGAVPDAVSDALGVRRIEIEPGVYAVPQIHNQFDPAFLLQDGPSKAARIVAKLTRLDVIVSAEAAAARDARRVNNDVKSTTNALAEAKEQCERLRLAAEDARAEYEKVDALYRLVCEAEDRLLRGVDAYERACAAQTVATRVLPGREELRSLMESIERGRVAYAQLEAYQKAKRNSERIVKEEAETQAALERARQALDAFTSCPLCGRPF